MVDVPDDKNLALLVEAVSRALRREGMGRPLVDTPPIVAISEDRLRSIIEEVAEAVFDREIIKTMARLGLRMDDEHIDETRRKIDGLFQMHQTGVEFVKRIIMTIGASFGLTVAALIGWNVTKSGTGGH